ncbi:hypothetical protein B5M42_013370 [Paenibacillus athensensis]|uniref:hypothetical protein n=1 Tax=Paenibacillus athensensis TaxID=1967502 RepID=UPI001430B38D|nr:hypothetical protein [Paenibacillus athensensis]MCD1259824.1 hypothetical protein [Paenibacillus athensensis]
MDKFVLMAIALGVVAVIFRLRGAYRKSRMNMDKGAQIAKKLEELRKKRDEE